MTSKDVEFDQVLVLNHQNDETKPVGPMEEFTVEEELDKQSSFNDIGDADHDPQQQDEPYIATKGNWWALQKKDKRPVVVRDGIAP